MENTLANSDLSCRLALSTVDMEQSDYDSRTALHIAAAEGDTNHHLNIWFLNEHE